MKRLSTLAIGAALSVAMASTAYAGGRLETVKILGLSTVPGFDLVQPVGIFWDDRCSTVRYTVDTVAPLGPGGTTIPIEAMANEIRASLASWTNIRTSAITMEVGEVRTIGNGTRSFDFINEVTFETEPGFGALARSPSTSLNVDATFTTGLDIDGDGDSDVFDPAAEARNTCFDADRDGDIEFPAGFYRAGTILDNDVEFGQTVIWETTPTNSGNADIQAVAVHEFGHSHGLSHGLLNAVSTADGNGATMFPFIDTNDAASEIGNRTLHTDDIAWSSFVYQEGSARSGPRALQRGDVLFDREFEVLRGTVTAPDGLPVLGASIAASTTRLGDGNSERDDDEDGNRGLGLPPFTSEILVDAFSGTTNLLSRQTDGILFLSNDDAVTFINGNFDLPVPRRAHYRLSLQATDGRPVATGSISLVTQVGGALGQLAFSEENLNLTESNRELRPFASRRVPAALGNSSQRNINFLVNSDIQLRNTGVVTNAGTGAVFGQQNVIYAERFSNAAVLAQFEAGASLTTALWDTTVQDASVNPTFQRAAIVLGRLGPDGATADVQLTNTLVEQLNFVGQDGDLTPLPITLAERIALRNALEADPTLDLFLVLEQPNAFVTGPSGIPPLLAIQATAPGASSRQSFLSLNGGPFNVQTTRNWAVELRFTPAAP